VAKTRSFCTTCGAPLAKGRRFCASCGEPAKSYSPSWQSAAAGVSRGASLASSATALPWQTITAGQPVDSAGVLTLAAPLLAQMRPRPNLRVPALGIVVPLVMDIAITLLMGGPISVPALGLRLLSGSSTALLGGIAGKGGGTVRKLTAISSVIYGLIQLVSLRGAMWTALATPAQLLPLLPSIIAVLAGLVLSVTTVVGAMRR